MEINDLERDRVRHRLTKLVEQQKTVEAEIEDAVREAAGVRLPVQEVARRLGIHRTTYYDRYARPGKPRVGAMSTE